MNYYADSNIGRSRQNNEDNFYAEKNIFIVADGMGGHLGGEVASRMAVDIIKKSMIKELSKKKGINLGGAAQDAIMLANSRILSESRKKKELSGMGTTVTLCAIKDKDCLIANAGDSRAYYYSNGSFRQVTTDHSLVEEMVRAGQITAEQARYHPYKNVITNVVGYQQDIYIDTFWLEVSPGDKLLLCTDGLTSAVDDRGVLRSISMDATPKEICRDLIEKANMMGGPDNITVIVIEI